MPVKMSLQTQYNLTNKYSFAEYQLSDFADAFQMYDISGGTFCSKSRFTVENFHQESKITAK